MPGGKQSRNTTFCYINQPTSYRDPHVTPLSSDFRPDATNPPSPSLGTALNTATCLWRKALQGLSACPFPRQRLVYFPSVTARSDAPTTLRAIAPFQTGLHPATDLSKERFLQLPTETKPSTVDLLFQAIACGMQDVRLVASRKLRGWTVGLRVGRSSGGGSDRRGIHSDVVMSLRMCTYCLLRTVLL